MKELLDNLVGTEWVSNRIAELGPQIDRDLDVTHRIERANICFYALLKLWARSITAAPVNKCMHIYNVCVKTALLYNIEATVLTETGLQNLEAAHRRHIRCLLKIRWPERISNQRLYETSGATSMRKEIMVRILDFRESATTGQTPTGA